jgi:hypothetical protein
MEDFYVCFFIYSSLFWNKFLVDETLSMKENLKHNLALAHVQEELLFPRKGFGFPLT